MFGIHISGHHNVQWMSDIVTVKRLVTTLPRECSICFPIRIRGELWLQEQGCSQLRQLFLEREEVATCWQRNNYASHKMRDTITKQPQFTQPVICNYCTYSQTRIIKVVEWHAVVLYRKQWKHTTAPSQWPAPATTCLCYKVRLLVPRTTHIHTLSRFTISDGLVRSSHSTYCNKKLSSQIMNSIEDVYLLTYTNQFITITKNWLYFVIIIILSMLLIH